MFNISLLSNRSLLALSKKLSSYLTYCSINETQNLLLSKLPKASSLTSVKSFLSNQSNILHFHYSTGNFENLLYCSSNPANKLCGNFRNFAKMSGESSFEKHEVVPDVIDTVPGEILNVCFGDVQAKEGNVLTPTQVKDAPKLSWHTEENTFYLICMTDPDAPSRSDPKFREWHHWLIGNIPGCQIQKGEVLSAYIGSGPPKDTGLHRYVLLVYKQKCKLDFDEPRLPDNSGDGRGGFKIADFAKKYQLGNPIAGNFYQAEWDNYVPELYKKLGVK